MKGNITENFTWQEFEHSPTALANGIDNSIPDTEAIRMPIRALAVNILQPLRDSIGEPLTINSGYRCKRLNKLVGGAKDSQHLVGEAADIKFRDPLLLAQHVIKKGLHFDQMILYATFVHISHKVLGPQRGEIIYDTSYKTAYPDSKGL